MSNRLVRLDLFSQQANASEHASILAALGDRLVQCIGNNAIEAGELETDGFRRDLDTFRVTLSAGSESSVLQDAAEKCVECCEGYFKRFHDYYAHFQEYLIARNNEFTETIDMLRAALAKGADDAESVNDSLGGSAQALKDLRELDDIDEMRRELSRAVTDLEEVVEEKKKLEQATHTKLSKQIAELDSKVEESRAEALKDALTSVANRRGFNEAIHRWTARSNRSLRPFTLAMIDLDGFKGVNDLHGHAIGDCILIVAARCLRNGIRSSDLLARYGGDEFVVMMEGIDIEQTKQRLGEIVNKIASARYEYQGLGRRVVVQFTASCGVSEFVPGEPFGDLIARADDALYEAKALGKNRVVVGLADQDDAVAAS